MPRRPAAAVRPSTPGTAPPGGEIRNVSQVLERLKESERLGLSWAAVPKRGLKEKFVSRQMQVKPVETLEEVVRWMKDAGTLKQEP
jgi:predicted ATP-dependent serine protease